MDLRYPPIGLAVGCKGAISIIELQSAWLATDDVPNPRTPTSNRGGAWSAGRKRGQRKGATSKNDKNCRKVSKIFLTLFDDFSCRAKNDKNRQKVSKYFRHFSTIFAPPVFRPLLGGSDLGKCRAEVGCSGNCTSSSFLSLSGKEF